MHSRSKSNLRLSQSEISLLLEYFPKGVCSFDLEMTGLSPLFDKIIEIAAIKINPDGSVEQFHRLVNPLITIPEHTIKYHGLNNDDLREEETLKNPLKHFIQFYNNYPLIAHNAKFDVSFVIRGIHENNLNISLSDVYDSCRFSRAIFKKEKVTPANFSLGELAKFYEIDFTHHYALDDSIAALKVFAQGLFKIRQTEKKNELKSMAFLFKLNSFQSAEKYILPTKLASLKIHVQKQEVISIKYLGVTNKNYRKVKPISLLPLPNGLILYALCIESNINKYFLIKKIKDIKSSDMT